MIERLYFVVCDTGKFHVSAARIMVEECNGYSQKRNATFYKDNGDVAAVANDITQINPIDQSVLGALRKQVIDWLERKDDDSDKS